MSIHLPILMYHQIAVPGPGDKPGLFVPPEAFREQLSFLADLGYRGVSPDEMAAALYEKRGASLPEKPLMITLDDADARSLGPALEVLAELSWPALGYFVAGDTETLPSPGQTEELRQLRFIVGSHTHTHRRLTELSDEASRVELLESRSRLETRMGTEVKHLAYPYGAFGPREVQLARELGYHTAVTTRRGNRHRKSDAFRLKRLSMRPYTKPRRIKRYLSRAWHMEHAIKERLGLENRGK